MPKKHALKYKEVDSGKKRRLSEKNASKYKEMESGRKSELSISVFHNEIKEGPCYICCVCHRLLYRKSVKLLDRSSCNSSLPESVFTDIRSFDNKEYICATCYSKVTKGKIPCQAVYNNMSVDEIPTELALFEKLKQILIAQRIVFEKIIVMPKSQQKKVSRAICDVPVNCDQTCKILPRPPERSGIIMLKLKRKLQFRGHIYFQAVRPQLIENVLNWLKQNNPLYCM